ncbi:MAG: DUF4294 domain-containing protein [Salibacteraceae bacterium]
MKTLVTSIIFLLVLGNLFSQDTLKQKDNGRLLSATLNSDGDTVPYVYMQTYYVWERRTFVNKKEAKKYNKLQRNVRLVYPYAKKASELLEKYSAEIEGEENQRKIKKYYKKIEEELWAEYGEELKEMKVSQGRILIKLIDRETDRTSYELVRELRSGFTAFVFQGMARMFGHDLKSEYNANEEDRYIEEIVAAIEMNQFSLSNTK